MKTKDFKTVALKYKTIFFDAFGVLKNHKGIIPGIERTFDFLDEHGINYFVVTNDSSRGPEGLADGYIRRGIKSITPDKIISSGMLAHDWLSLKIKNGTVAYLGTGDSAHYIETAGLDTLPIRDIDLNDIDHVKCLVFLDDEGFDWNQDINKVINLLRKKNMPVVVANTDIHYPVSHNDVAVAIGGISDLVEEVLGKKFIRFGKPDAQMFMFAYERACEVKPMKRNDILMVGDTLYTDIIGGNKFGMDTALVLSGNTLPEMAKVRISSSGIIPNYICDSAIIP
ncbi:HAD-IIA family hydrolase [Mangrovibacterium lignilyticum]|uniref:HAD-IIA family hydrolase n=1 Tax=Mangrovibacterium lignilyticum TaxID=2668052 RepID=UPI0013D08FA2|nr:HAD-IIA family hydrolase [Mangrovibacterium lignilyticum]